MPNLEPIQNFIVALVTCKYKEEPIKNEGARVVASFPHYHPMGAICCHGNQSSNSIWTKPVCSQFIIPMMRQILFDYDQSASLRDIHVCKIWTDGVFHELACIASTKF